MKPRGWVGLLCEVGGGDVEEGDVEGGRGNGWEEKGRKTSKRIFRSRWAAQNSYTPAECMNC
jgi:hypothetical protein